jgi:hypothetical protein
MTNSIEQGLREALLKLKKEMEDETVRKETVDKVEVWAEMKKLKDNIDESNDRAR